MATEEELLMHCTTMVRAAMALIEKHVEKSNVSNGGGVNLENSINWIEKEPKLENSINWIEKEPKLENSINWIEKEPKTEIDKLLNTFIIDSLQMTGIPILSEENEINIDPYSGDLIWIVDPLDGTYNFIRGLGPCAISVCLWKGQTALFGVILDIGTGQIAWGGKKIGSRYSIDKLQVSNTNELKKSVLCTGIPSSFDFSDKELVNRFIDGLSAFAKIRMIGSAASSLLLVARGVADCYYEQEIQIWDIAAGIALVEGAGGYVAFEKGKKSTTINLLASNMQIANACDDLLNRK